MPIPNIIAIDGPAASGKSTLGRRLANSLGYLFFDTGVMYRAVTWGALQRGLEINDEAAVTNLAETAQIDVRPPSKDDGRACDVLLDGVDITWETRRLRGGSQRFTRFGLPRSAPGAGFPAAAHWSARTGDHGGT